MLTDDVPRRFYARLKKFTPVAAALLLVAATVFAVLAAYYASENAEGESAIAALPTAPAGAFSVVIYAEEGEFPVALSRLFLDSAAISPAGSSPVASLLPRFDKSESAVVIVERENGFAMYGALRATDEEAASLREGKIPESLAALLVRPELHRTDDKQTLQLRALDLAGPLYLRLKSDNILIVADTHSDITAALDDRIARYGPDELPEEWSGRMVVTDGGVLGRMTPVERKGNSSLTVEANWRPVMSGDVRLRSEALWSISGLDDYVSPVYLRKLKPMRWHSRDIFIPMPLIASFGINLPRPDRGFGDLPQSLTALAGQLRVMGLGDGDIRSLLTGALTLSLGGKTQLLWFELPGIVADLPDRGEAGKRLLDSFWSSIFLGVRPKPIPGYDYGGAVELPFSVIGAANRDRVVIGLTAHDVDPNEELLALLAESKPAVAWLYVDLPKLGAAIADMPTPSAMLYTPDDEDVEEYDPADSLRDELKDLGRILITLEEDNRGTALLMK